MGRLSGRGIEAHPSPGEALAKTVWATMSLVGFAAGGIEAAWGPVGMVVGAVEAVLDAARPFDLAA